MEMTPEVRIETRIRKYEKMGEYDVLEIKES
jgi:hypothetical protein